MNKHPFDCYRPTVMVNDVHQALDEMRKHISALGAAASILKDQHRASAQCERPRTCGGCHFWSGVIEACRDLETGDKSTIRKALAIVNSGVNQKS